MRFQLPPKSLPSSNRGMKTIIPIIILLFALNVLSQEVQPIRILSKVIVSGNKIEMHYEDKVIPLEFENPETFKKTLGTSYSDVLVEGFISYKKTLGDSSQFKPVFIVKNLTIITLNELGKITKPGDLDHFKLQMTPKEYYISPKFPITAEVATAATLTGTFLLMDSLSAQNTDPNGRREINKALIISAGSMATLLFLYEQLSGKTKP